MKNYSGHIEFFSRKLAGELTPDELQDFSAWLSSSLENQEEFSAFEKVWNGIDIIKDKEPIDVNAAWNRFTKETQQGTSKTLFFRPLMAIAAIVTISLVSWFGYQLFFTKSADQVMVTTAMSQQKQVVLPDNSNISVNQNSSVTYPKTFNDERRIVLQGEAFFEVTRDETKPFIVEVNSLRIQVLGTSFLISENKETHSVTVIVKTGKVAVYKQESLDTMYLIAGERGELFELQPQSVKKMNTEKNYISWKTKTFEFENVKLQQVVNKINASYYSQIQIEDAALQECKITVSFKGKTLEQILEILEMTLDITIEKNNNKIFLKGKGC